MPWSMTWELKGTVGSLAQPCWGTLPSVHIGSPLAGKPTWAAPASHVASEQPQNGFQISLSMFKISSPFSFPFPSFPSRCVNPGSSRSQPIPGWLMALLAARLGSASLCTDAGSVVLTRPFCKRPSPHRYPNAVTAPSQTPTSTACLVSTTAVQTRWFCPKTPNKERNEGTCPSWHPNLL